jgi:hypothetical protein
VTAAPGRRGQRELAVWLAGAALLAAFALQGALSLRQKSRTADEDAHLAYGRRALARGTFARSDKSFDSTMPVTVLHALPVHLGRWANLGLALGLGLLVFAWGREAYGERAGVAALALFAFCPNLLAHGQLVTTDLAVTLAMFGAAWAFWRWERSAGPPVGGWRSPRRASAPPSSPR